METNLGIQEICALITGQSIDQQNNAPVNAFDAVNSYIFIGDGNSAVPTVAATDTQIVAAKPSTGSGNYINLKMVSGFPKVSGQTMQWEVQAGSSVGNFAWNEWAVANGSVAQVNSGGSTARYILNHKGIALGTKVSGETWSLQAAITQS